MNHLQQCKNWISSSFILILFFTCLAMSKSSGTQLPLKVQPREETTLHIIFVITNAGYDVTGTILSAQAEIRFFPGDLETSSITATADPSTLQTGIAIRDKHMKRTDYFDVDRHPLIYLRSKGFKKVQRNKYSGDFDLTIKEITKTVNIVFEVKTINHKYYYRGQFRINRLDFNIGTPSSILENEVTITLETVTGLKTTP